MSDAARPTAKRLIAGSGVKGAQHVEWVMNGWAMTSRWGVAVLAVRRGRRSGRGW